MPPCSPAGPAAAVCRVPQPNAERRLGRAKVHVKSMALIRAALAGVPWDDAGARAHACARVRDVLRDVHLQVAAQWLQRLSPPPLARVPSPSDEDLSDGWVEMVVSSLYQGECVGHTLRLL